MLIYLLRMPTATVIGTAAVLTTATMALATVMHALTSHLVDVILALVLMAGGVVGAQFGAQSALSLSPERLRFLLGFIILAVGFRFGYQLISAPENAYTIRVLGVEP
jgi:uncharacterized membrane protein YfcA